MANGNGIVNTKFTLKDFIYIIVIIVGMLGTYFTTISTMNNRMTKIEAKADRNREALDTHLQYIKENINEIKRMLENNND